MHLGACNSNSQVSDFAKKKYGFVNRIFLQFWELLCMEKKNVNMAFWVQMSQRENHYELYDL